MHHLRPTARRRLAELGLLGHRRHRKPTEPESLRLRTALEEMGPLFALFGRYLGSRVDLLPLAACTVLAESRIPDVDEGDEPPQSPAGIDIEPTPFRRSPLHLWYDGLLEDGQPVIIKTLRTGMVAVLENQIEELPLLEKIHLEDLTDVDEPIESYLVWLECQIDLRRELHGLRQLASEVKGFDALIVPRLWEKYCDRETVVFADPGGSAVNQIYDLTDDVEIRSDRARRLCSAWLQQVLLESILPEGPIGDNLWFLDDGRIAVTGGLFVTLRRTSRRSLLEALVATTRNDPDRACEHLLSACGTDASDLDHDRLQVLFRQAEPFRDGGWSERYRGRRLADTLFVQWRLLHREGVNIPPPVVAYLRGLHQIESSALRLDPDHDALADAVDDLGIVAAATHLRETLSVRRLRGVLEAAGPVLREFGETVERFGAASDGGDNGANSRRETRRRWSEVAGLLLLMVATVVTAHGLRAGGVGGEWLQASATTLFAVLAAAVLWRTARWW